MIRKTAHANNVGGARLSTSVFARACDRVPPRPRMVNGEIITATLYAYELRISNYYAGARSMEMTASLLGE